MDTKTPWPPPGVPTPGVPSARAPAPAGSPAPRGVWAAPKPLPPAPPVGGFIRKKGGFGDVDRGMGGYDADAAKRFIADLEYDDEYDDSFDELAEVARVGAAAGDVSEAGSGGGNNRRGGHDRGGGSYPESSGKGGAPRTFWIADGRVYHAPKEGATAVTARHVQEASAMAAVDAAARAAAVHGLGAGGNKAALAPGAAPFVPPAARGGRARGGGAGRGGGGRGPNRRGSGAPPGTRAHKNEHKATMETTTGRLWRGSRWTAQARRRRTATCTKYRVEFHFSRRYWYEKRTRRRTKTSLTKTSLSSSSSRREVQSRATIRGRAPSRRVLEKALGEFSNVTDVALSRRVRRETPRGAGYTCGFDAPARLEGAYS